jgi:hypothetical protein
MTGDAIAGLCQVFATLDRLLYRLIGSEESGGRRGSTRSLGGKDGDAEHRGNGRYHGALAEEWG